MPKVSVVIPTYNRPHLIKRAIRSVLKQTFQDFEIIVVDNGKKRVAKAISEIKDERIKYIEIEINKGAPVARNKGMKEARGEYIAFLDDDDEWYPEKLEKQVKALDNCDKEVVMVFCAFEMKGNKGKLLTTQKHNQSGVIWPFKKVLHRSYIWTSTLMIRKSIVEQGIFFDEKLKKHQEWDFQLRMLKVGKFFAIDEPLTILNVTDDEWHLGAKSNLPNIISAFEFFLKKHMDDYKKNKKSLAFSYLRVATLYKDNSQYKKAFFTLIKAWLANPLDILYFYYMFNSLFPVIFGEKIYLSLRKIFRKSEI